MDVRMFLNRYPLLYCDEPKRKASDVPVEDLQIIQTKGEIAFAIDCRTGDVYRRRESPNTEAQKPEKPR